MPLDETTFDEGLLERLVDFLVEEEGVVRSEITLDTALYSGGIIESMSMVRLSALIEDETGLTIPDRDLEVANFDTLRRIRAYLMDRVRT